jgi:hypothetical protein
MAVGLGSIDMPVPSVAEWEWLNWKFPRQVHAGDTIYAQWTLTQKRPPVSGAATSIVVWRVDIHTADGALCAEGEVGAKIRRRAGTAERHRPTQPAEPAAVATATATATAPRRRRRRRPASGNGTPGETPAIAAPPVAPVKPEKPAAGGRAPGTPPARRRRRRRPAGASAGSRDGAERAPGPGPAPVSEPSVPAPAPASGAAEPGTLSRVIRRLRRT